MTDIEIIWDLSQKENLTFSNKFLTCSTIHNRINRKWFILNLVGILLLYFLFDTTLVPYFSQLFTSERFLYLNIIWLLLSQWIWIVTIYLVTIQIIKRCHDFGNKGYGVAALIIMIASGVSNVLLPILGQGYHDSWLSYALHIWYSPVNWMYPSALPWILTLSYPLVIIIIVITTYIKWDQANNEYWKNF